MAELLHNQALWPSLVAVLIVQLMKVILVWVTERRLVLARMLETGGMPSSHSAAVAALATSIGQLYGLGSPYFALTAVLGGIVIYDATGIRRAAGVQAELINELVEELSHLFTEGFQPQVLKTLLGHTYPQVAVGVLFGVIVGLLAQL
ncbi:MAG: divergent PAP2 family protein [Truepera sp.]|nr:divergent PAP2 family protein [Truepera sp.]